MTNHNPPVTGFHTNPERINKDGAPTKPWTWAGLLREKLEEVNPEDKRQYKELVAEALRIKAAEGDVNAIKEFGNRLDGMPAQSIKQTNDGEIRVIISRYGSQHNPPTETTGGD